MIIKQYDTYEFEFNNSSNKNIIPIIQSMNNMYYIRMFLVHSVRDINTFIKAINTYSKDGMGFKLINIDIDNINNLVYLSESWYDYKDKPTTPEINELLEKENFIELCKIGFLDHITMTKDNFTHVLLTWDKIYQSKKSIPFILLYQDDKDWYDVKPFDTQEAMEQFVADHTQK